MEELYNNHNHIEGGLNNLSGTISTGRVFIKKIHMINSSGDLRFFQLFDTGSLPILADVPRRSYMVPASSSLEVSHICPVEFKTGSVFGWSDTYGSMGTGSFTELDVEIDYQLGE